MNDSKMNEHDELRSFPELLAGMFNILFRETAWNRVRVRALVDVLAEKDPTIYQAYDERLLQHAERDLLALEQRLSQPLTFDKLFETWIGENQARHDANLGEQAEKSAHAWQTLADRLNVQLEEMHLRLEALRNRPS